MEKLIAHRESSRSTLKCDLPVFLIRKGVRDNRYIQYIDNGALCSLMSDPRIIVCFKKQGF